MEKAMTVAMTAYHSATPGPWGVYRGGTGRSAFGGELVALFNTEEDALAFAAAPDLLADLLAAIQVINDYIAAHQGDPGAPDETTAYNALARFHAPSLAKAKG